MNRRTRGNRHIARQHAIDEDDKANDAITARRDVGDRLDGQTVHLAVKKPRRAVVADVVRHHDILRPVVVAGRDHQVGRARIVAIGIDTLHPDRQLGALGGQRREVDVVIARRETNERIDIEPLGTGADAPRNRASDEVRERGLEREVVVLGRILELRGTQIILATIVGGHSRRRVGIWIRPCGHSIERSQLAGGLLASD